MIRGNAVSWRFVRNLLVAFIPAALIGLILHNQIEALLGAPRVVAIALIVGGIAILVIERCVEDADLTCVAEISVVLPHGLGFIQFLPLLTSVLRFRPPISW